MIDLKNISWVLKERLTPQERYNIGILLKAAGFVVFPGIEYHSDITETSPYMAWIPGYTPHVFGMMENEMERRSEFARHTGAEFPVNFFTKELLICHLVEFIKFQNEEHVSSGDINSQSSL